MTRPQQQGIILGVLGLVMVVVYARAFGRPHHAPVAQPPVSAPSEETSIEPEWPDRSAQRRTQREELMQLAWNRDPFVRGASTDGAAGLSLVGIFWDAHEPLAMIGDETVGVGAQIGGFRVMQIDPDRVLLSDGNQTVTLSNSP